MFPRGHCPSPHCRNIKPCLNDFGPYSAAKKKKKSPKPSHVRITRGEPCTVLIGSGLTLHTSGLGSSMSTPRYTFDLSTYVTVQFPLAGKTTLHKILITNEPAQSFNVLPHTSLISTRPLSPYSIPYFKGDFGSYKTLAQVLGCRSLCSYAQSQDQSRTAYALKLVVDIENCLEQSRATERLIQEAKFYSAHLQKEQGRTVPYHYGLWGAETAWGGTIMLAILEWCGVPWSVLRGSQHDTMDRR
jgi:hypothetical protein